MIKEKLQRVRYDMENLVKKQYIYYGYYQILVLEFLYIGFDCQFILFDVGFVYIVVWLIENGGYFINIVVYGNSSCLFLFQVRVWKVIYFVVEFYIIEIFVCELWQCWDLRMYFKNY